MPQEWNTCVARIMFNNETRLLKNSAGMGDPNLEPKVGIIPAPFAIQHVFLDNLQMPFIYLCVKFILPFHSPSRSPVWASLSLSFLQVQSVGNSRVTTVRHLCLNIFSLLILSPLLMRLESAYHILLTEVTPWKVLF